MAINENDVELLHAYLDGELAVAECEGLWRRLVAERVLAGELDRLRADQAMRAAVWSSLEPGEEDVVNLQSRVLRAARRQEVLLVVNRAFRIAVTAAACILFGVTVGWYGHDHYSGIHFGEASNNSAQAISAENGTGVQHKFIVDVPDNNGRVIPLGQFDSYEEARQFAADFARHQANNQDSGNSLIVPAIDQY